MNTFIKVAALCFAGLAWSVANADENEIKRAFAASMPEITIDSIKPAEIKGIFEVTVGSSILYVSGDGKYLLQGRLIDVASRTDLTEKKLSQKRLAALERLGEDKMIIFKPKIQKYTVSIFTDIDCGYCRKLHSEIDQYQAEGITIRYLFFPRAGKGSESYNKAISVWCADDRNAALTTAKNNQAIPTKTCENPVDEHMKLAEEFEVRGTPMIVTERGNVYPGYLPAKQLVEALETEKEPN